MLDSQYLVKQFKNPYFNTIVFELQETEEIAGCMKLIVDPHHRTGYVRGFMVRPKYMGKIDASIMCMMLHEWAELKQGSEFDLVYSEIRTVHPKSQAVCLKSGYRPAAFFANKDVFKGDRETDILIIDLKQKALEMRNPEVKLIPQAMELFNHQTTIYEGMLQYEFARLYTKRYYGSVMDYQDAFDKISVKEEADKYGYISFSFSLGTATLTGLYTPMVGAIEKIEYSYSTLEEFEVLMAYLRNYYMEKDAQHCEVFASAYIPEEQAILDNLGFSVVGYAVAWRSISEELREDAVVFALFSQPPDKDEMDLSPECERFYQCVYSKPDESEMEKIKQSFLDLYTNGLERDSAEIAGYALQNIAELFKLKKNYSKAIIYLKEASDLYAKCDTIKAKRCFYEAERLKLLKL